MDIDCRYIFIGNRMAVLNKLIENHCDIKKIYAVKDSFLAKELKCREIHFKTIGSKSEFISDLKHDNYDILVSNGCPYILPINYLNNGRRKFINIHPSLLPDLRGKHPINGAILYNRRHGVTCHLMDDGIDTGEIVEQIEISIDNNINLDLLYKITFLMEGEVFERALKKHFSPDGIYRENSNCIYYTRCEDDMLIKNTDNIDMIIRRINAFNTKGLYAKIKYNDHFIRLIDCKVIKNDNYLHLFGNYPNFTIIDKYGNGFFLYKSKTSLLQFETLDIDLINIGEEIIIGNEYE